MPPLRFDSVESLRPAFDRIREELGIEVGFGDAAETEAAPAAGPADHEHAAIAAPYVHVTAPLRRLVDRFANELALAGCEARPAESWSRDALGRLPALMAESRRREGDADRRVAEVVEAAVLAAHTGRTLSGVVVRADGDHAQVQVTDPAVIVSAEADGAGLGDEVEVRVDVADPAEPRVVVSIVS